MDWLSIGPKIRPGGLTDEQWTPIFEALQDNIGDTWGEYVTTFARDATRLGERGNRDANVLGPLNLEIAKAQGLGVSQISGVTIDAVTGNPISMAQLVLSASTELSAMTTTDAQGRFTFTSLLPGEYQFIALDADLQTVPSVTVTIDTDTLNVVLKGTRTSISGTAVSADLTVGGRELVATNTVTAEVFSALIAEDGSFTINKINPGTYTFTSHGAIISQVLPDPVTVAQGQALSGVTLTLAAGASLSGSVTSAAKGNAVGDAEVSVMSGNTLVGATRTDDAGNYTIAGLTPDSYTVMVSADGYPRTWLSNIVIAEGGRCLNIQLGDSAAITGSVTVNGAPGGEVVMVAKLPKLQEHLGVLR